MILTDQGGGKIFVVAQQLRFGYELHAFENRDHFQAWMKTHPTRGMVEPGQARGRAISARPLDHRFDDGEPLVY